eukprot:snap_masked-scaffold_12-processed-gene-1.48-mRNA-1 protein AED:1.00 eAED:1.00 QI:0/-1/0/0/-1/1/1/0/424
MKPSKLDTGDTPRKQWFILFTLSVIALLSLMYSFDRNDASLLRVTFDNISQPSSQNEVQTETTSDQTKTTTSPVDTDDESQNQESNSQSNSHEVIKQTGDVDFWEYTGMRCNLLYVKLKKTASSTVAGVTRGIAARSTGFKYIGVHTTTKLKRNNLDHCKVMSNHGPQPYQLPEVTKPSLRPKTFMFTVVRDPKRRFMSFYFHVEVSRDKKPFTDSAIKKYITKYFDADLTTRVMGTQYEVCRQAFRRSRLSQSDKLGEECVLKIMNEFDFIGLTERLPESLIVLKNILGLEYSDILFIGDSKTNGGYDDQGAKIHKTIITDGVQQALDKKAKSFKYFFDQKVWDAADKKLTQTIEHMGVDKIEKEVAEFKSLQLEAEEYCKGRIHFPYDVNGKKDKLAAKDCYWNDNGCGIPCLNEFITNQIH